MITLVKVKRMTSCNPAISLASASHRAGSVNIPVGAETTST